MASATARYRFHRSTERAHLLVASVISSLIYVSTAQAVQAIGNVGKL